MRGQVVREKLHGRTAQGTWVQLEKTPAAFGKRKLPSLNDIRHLMDYVIYRVTRSNVGPWGLSAADRAAADVPVAGSGRPHVAAAAGGGVAGLGAAPDLGGRRHHRGVARIWRRRFPPPDQADPANELGQALPGRAGRGLFGNSEVWVTETPSAERRRDLGSSCASSRRPDAWWAGAGAS